MAKPADTRQMIERLKECPFCGGQPELRNDDDEVMREIVCSHCDFAITESANPEGAIARWNTRSTIETLTPSAAGEGERAKAYTENGLDYVQYEIERVISRRVMEDRINGYTLEMAEELAAVARTALASLASPPQPHPDIEGRAIKWARDCCASRFERRDPPDKQVATSYRVGLYDDTPDITLRVEAFKAGAAITLPCAEIRREALLNGCNALLGLVQLILARDDLPADLREALSNSHRIDEAKAAVRIATQKDTEQ